MTRQSGKACHTAQILIRFPMFTIGFPSATLLPVPLSIPVVDSFIALPSKRRPTQLHLLDGGGLALVHRAGLGPEVDSLEQLLDAWQYAEVSVNLLEPLEGIPLVLLAAQVGHLPAMLSDIYLGKVSHAMGTRWLQEAASQLPAVLQLVLVEPSADSPSRGIVRSSRSLVITDPAFWRPLCRVLGEQLALIEQGDASILTVAANAILARAGAASGVLAGGPVAQKLT